MASRITFSVTETASLVENPDSKAWKEWMARPANYNMGPTKGPVPQEVLLDAYRITRGSRMFDYNSGIVSDRFKKAVESIEPDTHQFVPAPIFYKDGRPFHGSFWRMLICAEIDAILLTSGVRKFMTSPTPEQEPDSFNWQLVTPLPDKPDLAVRNSVIKGRAIWTDYRMSYASVFVSDAMRDLYAKAGMSGWDERNYWREE